MAIFKKEMKKMAILWSKLPQAQMPSPAEGPRFPSLHLPPTLTPHLPTASYMHICISTNNQLHSKASHMHQLPTVGLPATMLVSAIKWPTLIAFQSNHQPALHLVWAQKSPKLMPSTHQTTTKKTQKKKITFSFPISFTQISIHPSLFFLPK